MDVYTAIWTNQQRYNYLIDMNIVSEEALDLVVAINGYNQETFEDVLYNKTGYKTFESYVEEV